MVLALPPSYQGQQVRFAVEQGFGVLPANPAWKILKAGMINPSKTFEADPFMSAGDLLPTIMSLNDEFTEGDIEGKGDFNSIVYYLSSLFGRVAPEPLGGGAYRWRFRWNGRRRVRPVSYTMAYGQPGEAELIPGVVFNAFSISGGREDGFEVGGSILGKAGDETAELGGITNEAQTVTVSGAPTGGTFTLTLPAEAGGEATVPIPWNATAGAVLSALEAAGYAGNFAVSAPAPGGPYTVSFVREYGGLNVGLITATHALTGGTAPTVAVAQLTPGSDAAVDIPPVPLNAPDGRVFLDNAWAALGTSKLLQIYELNLEFADRFERVRPINKERDSDNVVESGDQEHTLGLTFAIDAAERRNYDRIRKGTPTFPRVEWEGPEIAPGVPYLARFDLAAFFSEAAEVSDTQSVATREWTSRLANSGGNGIEVTVVNTLAGLE